MITTAEECGAAASALGLSDRTATVSSTSYWYPPGCYESYYGLQFNPTHTGSWSGDHSNPTHTGSCSPDCALHMFTQSDVLFMGRSGFPIFAAAMRNETMMLPVKCHEGGSGDASFGHTLDTAGGFIADSDALEADLRRRLPERCLKSHVTPSQLVSFAAEELR